MSKVKVGYKWSGLFPGKYEPCMSNDPELLGFYAGEKGPNHHYLEGVFMIALPENFCGASIPPIAFSPSNPVLTRFWWVGGEHLPNPQTSIEHPTLPAKDPDPTPCLRCTNRPPYYVKNHKEGFLCFSCRTNCRGLPILEGSL